MKSLTYKIACGILLIGTIGGGWLHGRVSNRWGAGQALRQAAAQLNKPLPARVGNWRLVAERQFEDDVVQMLQCPAHLWRTYANDQTGDTINVAVTIGPPGPISVHTPEVCYSSQDYEITNSRLSTRIRDRDGNEHSLWDLRLQARDVGRSELRVMYAWGDGATWRASERARYEYAGVSYLYNIQAAAPILDPNSEFDACRDFLEVFLAELRANLVSTETSVSAANHQAST